MIFLILAYMYYEKHYAVPKDPARAEGIENFETSSDDGSVAASIIGSFISFFIGIYALYLSWSCNTKENVSGIGKVFFAFWAWFFGIFYLLYYWIARSRQCQIS